MTLTLHFKDILCYIQKMQFCERPDYVYIQDVLHEIRAEKNVNFNLPYDWEAFNNVQDIIAADSVSILVPREPQVNGPSVKVEPKAEPLPEVSQEEEPPNEPEPTIPASIDPQGNSTESRNKMVEVEFDTLLVDKVIEVDMGNDCVNLAEKKTLKGKSTKTRQTTGDANERDGADNTEEKQGVRVAKTLPKNETSETTDKSDD